MSDSIHRILNLAESCVFDKQSLLPALCPCINNNYLTRLLIPKLRSYFAEFLQHYYPNHLSILYQSTCVQFRVRPFIYKNTKKPLYIFPECYANKYLNPISIYLKLHILCTRNGEITNLFSSITAMA